MLTLVSKPDTPVLPLALGPDLTGGATAQEGGEENGGDGEADGRGDGGDGRLVLCQRWSSSTA